MQSKTDLSKKHWNTVIIGGGQAGLAAGYFLKKKNKEFIILDENENIGDSWRKRWDSLRLFTPSQHDGLPGMRFPGSRGSLPGKDQMAGYLESYVLKFSLPVQCGIKVTHLQAEDNRYTIETSAGNLFADNVVVTTGTNPLPYTPAIAADLAPDIHQLHSSKYVNPELLPEGDTLVVGAGTSGVEIALELSKTRKTYISGKPTFHIPDSLFKYVGGLYWLFISHVLTLRTPIGKKARKSIINGGAPLISISADDLDKAGIKRLPRLTGAVNGVPQFADGSLLPVSSVIWATGYKPDFSWIGMNVTDETGWPRTKRGISISSSGLYFVGMPFQYGLTSGLVGGVGRDASYVTRKIMQH
jgi:putative flavoprotein involved in K+ transport